MHALRSFIILAAGRAFLCHAQSVPVESVGCWTDTSDRIFATQVQNAGDMTVNSCARECLRRRSAYMAVQNGAECWCGTIEEDYTRHGSSQQCNKPCSGDWYQLCGGEWAAEVYRVGYVYGENPGVGSCRGRGLHDIPPRNESAWLDGGIHITHGLSHGECCELCQNLPDCVVAEYSFAVCVPLAKFIGAGDGFGPNVSILLPFHRRD